MIIRIDDVLLLLIIYRLGCAASRVKRIMNGIPLMSRTSGYNAVRFYVWISNGEECSFKHADWLTLIRALEVDDGSEDWLGFRCIPDASNIRCSGSLITPQIVQTACHCLAMYELSSDPYKPMRAVLERLYEGRFKVYLGINQVEKFGTGMPTSKHFVHQKCTQQPYRPYATLWDYGWMVLQSSVEEWPDFPQEMINYAPQYSTDELVTIWNHTLRTQAVCLILGFGGHRELYPKDPLGNDDFEKEPYEEPSDVLLHGWVATERYLECRNYTDWFNLTRQKMRKRQDELQYLDDATWGCGIPFTSVQSTLGTGDSGGPATCNNHYVGVNSQSKKVRLSKNSKIKTWIPLYMATRFVLLENAIEYRKQFMKHIDHYTEFTENGRNQPLITFRPPLLFSQLVEAKASVRSHAVRLDGAVCSILMTSLLEALWSYLINTSFK